MTVRAKFVVTKVTHHSFGQGVHEEVHLAPVYSTDPNHENKAFWEATPQGELRMYITNPGVHGVFHAGHEFYVDFTEAPTA